MAWKLKGALVPLGLFIASTLYGQTFDCSEFLKNPIFTKSTIQSTQVSRDRFRLLQCSANWKNAKEAQSAGVDITVPIYDIPVPLEANWSQEKVESWKSKNCSNEERSSVYQTTYFQSVSAIDPITAKAALECVGKQVEAEVAGNKALRCRINEGASVVMFEAEWRRTAGETTGAPVVKSFEAVNTTCQGAATTFAPGASVIEGGMAVMCTYSGSEAPAMSLNTNRGSCTTSAAPRLPAITLPNRLEITGPYLLAGREIVIPANTKIVTNGFPFNIRADKLRIEGPSQIVSFEPRTVPNMQPGRYASPINIVAKDVVGAGLSILNAGEPGGNGNPGSQGPQGAQGGPGQPRHPLSNSCGILSPACNLAPIGCTGGQDGGQGAPGAQGFPGLPGAPGGGAADVIIDVPVAAQSAFAVLTNVNIAGQAQTCNNSICGGLGGQGGPGGPGGPGGDGGPGAPGSTWCGGTNTGPRGSAGPQGPIGNNGPEGTRGFVKFL